MCPVTYKYFTNFKPKRFDTGKLTKHWQRAVMKAGETEKSLHPQETSTDLDPKCPQADLIKMLQYVVTGSILFWWKPDICILSNTTETTFGVLYPIAPQWSLLESSCWSCQRSSPKARIRCSFFLLPTVQYLPGPALSES